MMRMSSLVIVVVEILLSDQAGFQVPFQATFALERHQAVVNIYLETVTANYGSPDFERLHKEANEDTWIIPMIETVQAMGTVL